MNRTHPRLSTLGEFRGLGANDITRVHSGMDIAIAGGNVDVYSPDTGLVRRYKSAYTGNPSAGSGPIRVGHFGFNHITTIHAEAGKAYAGVAMPANLRVYVVEPRYRAYAPKPGVANPRLDKHFRSGRVPRNRPAVAYRKLGPNRYERSTLWPRTLPIGTGVRPTDLHVIYYTSADGPYADGRNVANCLEVLRNYFNRKLPIANALRMYTQNGGRLFLDLAKSGAAAIHTPAMRGLDFKLWAYSPFNAKCGLYQIEYEILNHRGKTTGRLNAWTFHRNPPDAVAFDLVDPRLSLFATVNNKHTVYTITNSHNGAIRRSLHWEIENPVLWRDGCYAIRVWIKNIRRSVGVGRAPHTNERLYGAEWKVETLPNNRRKVTVTRAVTCRAANWQPAFAECKSPKKRRPPKRRSEPGAPKKRR